MRGILIVTELLIAIYDFDAKKPTGCSLVLRCTSVTEHFLVFLSFQFKIRAGTREPEKCKHLNEMDGVTVVKAVMGDEFGLNKAFEGTDYLFLVTPSVMASYSTNHMSIFSLRGLTFM